jgi:hypothetical protein
MAKFFKRPPFPFSFLKKRREFKQFQKELDKPIRVPRQHGRDVPRIISFQTISLDASSSKLDASLPTLVEDGMDFSNHGALWW